jgi:RNA polymerase sigma factor (sigma-70 family)
MADIQVNEANREPPEVRVALPPTRPVVESLSAEDQLLLTQLLTEPPDYIDHPDLARRGADKALFGVETKLIQRRGTRFIRPNPVVKEHAAGPSRVPTLTSDQERLLFLRFNYARRRIRTILDRSAGRRLAAADTRKLLAWGHRMLGTRSEIVRFNLPLVLAMAKRTRLSSIDYNELISEGNVALLRSVEKFDCGRGFKFSTYACRAILKSFSRVAMRASRYRVQFPCEFDPSMERSDYIDRKREGVEIDCVDELKRILLQNLADLNDVERTVIKERFALLLPTGDQPPVPGEAPKTLEQVGLMIGVTKERVRQIQNKALRKIRDALETEYLVA